MVETPIAFLAASFSRPMGISVRWQLIIGRFQLNSLSLDPLPQLGGHAKLLCKAEAALLLIPRRKEIQRNPCHAPNFLAEKWPAARHKLHTTQDEKLEMGFAIPLRKPLKKLPFIQQARQIHASFLVDFAYGSPCISLTCFELASRVRPQVLDAGLHHQALLCLFVQEYAASAWSMQ